MNAGEHEIGILSLNLLQKANVEREKKLTKKLISGHAMGSNAVIGLDELSDKELTEVDDVIEAAVAQTIIQGGHVEIVADNPNLEEVGGIGALLRF